MLDPTWFVSDFAKKNASNLKKLGVKVVSGVDATNLHKTVDLKDQLFDLVVFMFPHIGGKMKIQKNRDLIKDFAVNIRPFLNFGGSVIVTLAGGQGGTPVDPIQRRYLLLTLHKTQILGVYLCFCYFLLKQMILASRNHVIILLTKS